MSAATAAQSRQIQSPTAALAYPRNTAPPRSNAAPECRTDAPRGSCPPPRFPSSTSPWPARHPATSTSSRSASAGSVPAGARLFASLQRQPRTNRTRAISNQHRRMMNVAASPASTASPASVRSPAVNQRLMHRTRRHRHRNRQASPHSPTIASATESAHHCAPAQSPACNLIQRLHQRLLRPQTTPAAPPDSTPRDADTCPLRSASTCPSERNGEGSESPGSGAFLSSRWGHGPSRVCSDTTHASRNGSIAGFVTCANRCRKYAYSGRGDRARNASGVSSPIDHTASLPSTAIGCRIIFTSSRV